MNIKARLHLITPCFCAGANRLVAEIRAPSIRGELRWWFRCVGGDTSAEESVFGSVAGHGNASTVQLRVGNVVRADKPYRPTHAKLTDPGSYLHFYLDQPPSNGASRMWTVAPDRNTGTKGTPRPEACLPTGSEFTLLISAVRRIPDEQKSKLDLAVRALLRFGSLGFRHTRGFGSWNWQNQPITEGELKSLADEIKAASSGFEFWFAPGAANQPDGLLNQVESKLKAIRNPAADDVPKLPAKMLTALGHAGEHGRQASAVRFRPVQIQTKKGDAQYKLVIFQAPDGVLGPNVKEPKRIVPGLIPK